jgi:hypothetical protein
MNSQLCCLLLCNCCCCPASSFCIINAMQPMQGTWQWIQAQTPALGASMLSSGNVSAGSAQQQQQQQQHSLHHDVYNRPLPAQGYQQTTWNQPPEQQQQQMQWVQTTLGQQQLVATPFAAAAAAPSAPAFQPPQQQQLAPQLSSARNTNRCCLEGTKISNPMHRTVKFAQSTNIQQLRKWLELAEGSSAATNLLIPLTKWSQLAGTDDVQQLLSRGPDVLLNHYKLAKSSGKVSGLTVFNYINRLLRILQYQQVKQLLQGRQAWWQQQQQQQESWQQQGWSGSSSSRGQGCLQLC